jgi:hypothetical protein
MVRNDFTRAFELLPDSLLVLKPPESDNAIEPGLADVRGLARGNIPRGRCQCPAALESRSLIPSASVPLAREMNHRE